MTPNKNKLTLADIEAEIASEHYFTARDGVAYTLDHAPVRNELPEALAHVTFCVLILHNGHKAIGINHGPVDPANFDPELGKKYAREDAIDKLWELLGFRLRDQLANARPALTAADAAADLAGTPRPDWKG